MLNVLLLGPQGSGKGTQAKMISAEYGVPHIATGDMFRAAIAGRTELGRKIEPILSSGALVPDEITIGVMRDRLQEPDALSGFVLDGFPRNLEQARALDGLLTEIGRPLSAVLVLVLDDAAATERLLGRGRDEGRPDDNLAVIEERLRIYHEQTEPLSEYYSRTHKLVGVDAAPPVEVVFGEIRRALGQEAA